MTGETQRVLITGEATAVAELAGQLLPTFATRVEPAPPGMLRKPGGAGDVDAIVICVPLGDGGTRASLIDFLSAPLDPAVIVVTSMRDAAFEAELLRLGAQDCLTADEAKGERFTRAVRFAIERRRRQVEFERSCRDLRRFSHIVAHALRSPISVLTVSTDVLLRTEGSRLEPRVREWVEQCKVGALELSGIVTQILAFAEAGALCDVDPVDCNVLLGRIRTALIARWPHASTHLTHERLPVVAANEIVLRMALQNLVAAALDPGSRLPPRAHIACRPDEAGWTLMISQTEPSLSPSQFDQALRLLSGEGAASGSAAVVGLVVARDALERMGGRVWVETTADGRGAIMVLIPQARSLEAV